MKLGFSKKDPLDEVEQKCLKEISMISSELGRLTRLKERSKGEFFPVRAGITREEAIVTLQMQIDRAVAIKKEFEASLEKIRLAKRARDRQFTN